MWIAEAKKKTAKRWRNREVTWEQFTKMLETPMRTKETMREYKAMAKPEKDVLKELPGGFVGGYLLDGVRKTANVRERSMVTLDADHAGKHDWSNFTVFYPDLACVCYSTHTHTPESPRLRWILPANRPILPDEYACVSRTVASWIGIDTIDPTTHDLCRLFYYPGVSADATYVYHIQLGQPLDVDAILASYGPEDAWRDSTLWPIAKEESEVVVTDRNKKLGDPGEKNGIIGLFCRTFSIYDVIDQFLSDVYEDAGPDRYTYTGGSTAGGARVYNGGAYLYSSHATDPAAGRSVNAFDLVRLHKFGHLDETTDEDTPVSKLPSFEAMSKWANDLPEIKRQLVEEKQTEIREQFGDLNTAKTAADDGVDVEDDDVDDEEDDGTDGPEWEKLLAVDAKTGAIKPTLNNAILWIRNHPDFRGKLGYNPMSDDITVSGTLPWAGKRNRRKKKKGSLDDVVTADGDGGGKEREGIWSWKTENPDFLAYFEKLGYNSRGEVNGLLENALKSVAMEHTFHPIKHYLEELEWDGVERLDTFFIRWLGAEDNELNRTITRLWMIGAVDRVVRPGQQFDQILITCGKQGLGKSKLLRLLAKGFFTCSTTAANMDKKTAEILQGMWIVEMGELDTFRKQDQNTLKNFITATTDRYRSAYARQAETHPRQCVFAGTCNDGSFLRDDTGERRYWIMPVVGIGDRGELRGVEKEIDQVWAEAVFRWKERLREFWEPGQTQNEVNMYLYLREDRLEQWMTQVRAQYKLPDNLRADILGYLDLPRPANWYQMPAYERRNFAHGEWLGDESTCTLKINKVFIKELRCELLDGDKSDKDMRIGTILDNAPGWKKSKRQGRNAAYAKWPMPMWVRVGSVEDTDEEDKQ